jgi:predicted ArsR family transcriptional regulator
MFEEILRQIETAEGPLSVKELAERLDVEEGALEPMLAFLEKKGKLSVYRPGVEQCGPESCVSCVFGPGCPDNREGGVS